MKQDYKIKYSFWSWKFESCYLTPVFMNAVGIFFPPGMESSSPSCVVCVVRGVLFMLRCAWNVLQHLDIVGVNRKGRNRWLVWVEC
jgi:hypothetical protein